MSSLLSRLLPVVLLGLLLAFPALSVAGAQSGLLLWFNVVLPTLSPFIICTQMVIALDAVELLIRPFYPAIRALFGLSPKGSYVLLCGLLCGYPLGARLCSQYLEGGSITKAEADYLLAICNHPSPMFLLGYVCSQIPFVVSPLLLMTCLYLPVLPISFAARRIYGISRTAPSLAATSANSAGTTVPATANDSVPRISLEDIIYNTCETMVLIGGYIMLFSILTAWIMQLPFLSPASQAILTGIAEITTGVHQICTTLPTPRILPAVVGVVAFGGFSGIFQTKGVIKNAGLSIRHYLIWKAVHACLSCILLTALLSLRPR